MSTITRLGLAVVVVFLAELMHNTLYLQISPSHSLESILFKVLVDFCQKLSVKLETSKYLKVIDWYKLLLWKPLFVAEKYDFLF